MSVPRRMWVLGAGRSGRAAAELAIAGGFHVVVVDQDTASARLPGATLVADADADAFDPSDTVVVSPGFAVDHPIVLRAKAAGARIIGELAWAFDHFSKPVIAVTGTNGKSTVTHLIGQLLRLDGRRPFVGGNLGLAFCHALLDDTAWTEAVVEVSSYQMEWPGAFRPHVGLWLNLAEDHLERHGDMATYAHCKAQLFSRQGPEDWALFDAGNARIVEALERCGARKLPLGAAGGVRREGRSAWLAIEGRVERLSLDACTLLGAHNLDNVAAALAAALVAGVAPEVLQASVAHLEGLPHRMEGVAIEDGVQWINDSKSTNLASLGAALASVGSRAVVLVGGRAKRQEDGRLGFGALAPALQKHRGVVTFGASGPAIAEELAGENVVCTSVVSLEEAVSVARGMARPSDAVLFSPGCASFDAFDDFEHRGGAFKRLVGGDRA